MSVADTVSTVLAPELFVLVATLLLVGVEQRDRLTPRPLVPRVGAVLGAWVLAFVTYAVGGRRFAASVPGGDDFFAALGLIVAFAAIALAWGRFDWGSLVPPYAGLLIATSLLHLAVVPLWDTSSHVIYAAVPAGALVAADRRFGPLLLAAPLLVWSRIATGAHTVAEAVGGLLVAGVVLGGALAFGRLPGEDGPGTGPR